MAPLSIGYQQRLSSWGFTRRGIHEDPNGLSHPPTLCAT